MATHYLPTGDKVLIKIIPPKTRSQVIELTEETKKANALSTVRGTIVATGPQAWSEYGGEKCYGIPWASVGDTVLFQQYAGMKIPNEYGEYKHDLVLVLDRDITAKVVEVEENAKS